MAEVLDGRSDGLRAVLETVARRLREGQLVALPTEAGYEAVASALHADAVASLRDLVGPTEPPAVALGAVREVFDWLPYLRGAGLRLLRAFWPGPLTLVSNAGAAVGLLRRLPTEVRRDYLMDNHLAVRMPDHDWPGPLSRLLAGPLLAASLPGFPRQIDQIATGREKLALIVDGGPSVFVKPASIIQITRNWPVAIRDGAVPWADVQAAAPCRIVFVCTGNTCRSPLAEGLCRSLLSAKVANAGGNVRPDSFCVQSAGMAAAPGNLATAEAVAIAQTYGVDLSGHRSQPLSIDLLSQADQVFTMTWTQLSLLHHLRGAAGPPPQLLATDGSDIDDPLGGAGEVYRACAVQIWQYLNERLPELLES